MEREELEKAIRRYETILRQVSDERVVAVVTGMLADTRDRLSKIDQIEAAAKSLGTSGV
jgi:hypothetical protein